MSHIICQVLLEYIFHVNFDNTLNCTWNLGINIGPYVYYLPEVRRGEYCGLQVFLLQYFPLAKT